MGYAGIAAQTTTDVLGQYYKGKAAKESADFDAQIAENNAMLAEQEAQWANKATQQRMAKHFREVGQIQSSNRVAYAKSGVQLDSGSPLAAAISTAKQSELDAEIISTEGNIAAYNASLKANQFMRQAEIAEYRGKQAQTESYFGMGGSLLKGGSDMYDLWKTKKKKGS